MRRALALIATMLTLPACATVSAADLQNALLSPSTPQARAQITQIIQAATANQSLKLSAISLTKSARLPIVKQFPSGPIRDALGGRRIDMPRFFTLKTDGARCWLYDDEADELHMLETRDCKAAG